MKLQCGHYVSVKLFAEMYKKRQVRCPKCGQTWRGYMVINHDKQAPKRELEEAGRRGKMTTKEFFRR